ncbi:MAG: hypothetical protein UX89_C0030G0001 [Parcubacteria group bacterium GW2011_GWA2_47_16]|nr:MAG: hypothetical protein UX89_C0030G0001 [Parcubacteria group bacterium GW2011_GWA2_47_16]
MKTTTVTIGRHRLRVSKNLSSLDLFTLRTLMRELQIKAFKLGYPKAKGVITHKRFDRKHKEPEFAVITPPYRLLVRRIKALSAVLFEHGL